MLRQIIILFWHFELGSISTGNQLISRLKRGELLCEVVEKLQLLKSTVALLQDKALYQSVLQLYKDQQIELITVLDTKFPIELFQMWQPPLVIAIKGNSKLLEKRKLAIISDENMSDYALQIVNNVVPTLHQYSIIGTILSNVCAVTYNIANKCKVPYVLVLASGFEHIYPWKHLFLEKHAQIIGVVVTEYPLQHRFSKCEILRHKAFVATLSHAIFVVECEQSSYTLLTAYYGLEMNKDIIVPPANLFTLRSVGTNLLLQNGAFMYLHENDITDIMAF